MPTSWNIQERNYKSDHKFFGKDKGVASSEFYDAWEPGGGGGVAPPRNDQMFPNK